MLLQGAGIEQRGGGIERGEVAVPAVPCTVLQ